MRLPALGAGTPRGAAVSVPAPTTSRSGVGYSQGGGDGGLPAVSPRAARGPSGAGGGAGGASRGGMANAHLFKAAETVGQPTSDRAGAGALPMNPWLAPRPPPMHTPAAYAVRSPRHVAPDAANAAGDPGAYEYGQPLRKPMRRDEEMSRRILASLAYGGKLQDEVTSLPEPMGRFVVPAKNAYTSGREEDAKALEHKIGATTEKIIRRRLGLG